MSDHIRQLGGWLAGHWRQLLVLAVLGGVLAAIISAGLTPAGLVELLRENRQAWSGWIEANLFLAALAYTLFYMLAVSVSLPGALWFTIGAGYLLGATIGIPVSLVGVTVGAANIFLVARYLAGPGFHERFDGRIARFAAGFRRDDLTYVILLRMTPTPFFMVNVAAALLGANFRNYVLGTFIGAMPATILYANLGAGLGELVDAGVQPGLADLARPSFLVVLGMALFFAFIPLIHRAWKRRARLRDNTP